MAPPCDGGTLPGDTDVIVADAPGSFADACSAGTRGP